MAAYDREFTTALERRTRLRIGFRTFRGTPTAFVVQLEYRLGGEWRTVARFDHNPTLEMGHDVTEEGLHMDIYRNGRKHDVERDFPSVPLSRALDYCITHLKQNADDLTQRYQRWHETNPQRTNRDP